MFLLQNLLKEKEKEEDERAELLKKVLIQLCVK
jgi:hypothetical protein